MKTGPLEGVLTAIESWHRPGAMDSLNVLKRDMLFISHANPEDNDFSRWLALQLAKSGYPVWCDLTKLLGGEDFWKDVEEALRQRTCKFLFVLSESSNTKDGPLQEVHVAKAVARETGLRNFIVPLHLGKLPHSQTNIELSRLNAISFSDGWPKGLAQLLQRLEEDGVAKKPGFNATAVNAWWRQHFNSEKGVLPETEEYLSNWFPIKMPSRLQFHLIERSAIGLVEIDCGRMPYAALQDGIEIVSFASADDLGDLGQDYAIVGTRSIPTEEMLYQPELHPWLKENQGRNFVSRLIRDGWERFITGFQCLSMFKLASGADSLFFRKGFARNDEVLFHSDGGRTTRKQLVGYRTMPSGLKRFWHFGIDAKPTFNPFQALTINAHVFFSDDGKTLWQDPRRMHRARRSQCKTWYNDDWRDRVFAAMAFLAGDSEGVHVPLGANAGLKISVSPIPLLSPVRYVEPEDAAAMKAALTEDFLTDAEDDEYATGSDEGTADSEDEDE